MKTMQNRKMSLEPLQTLRQLYQYYLFDKDQQQVRKDQLQVLILENSAQSHDSGRTVPYPDL